MGEYLGLKNLNITPRIPTKVHIDVTYRCNNRCRHCWLIMEKDSPGRRKELSTQEIKDIVDQARNLGCREWSISGGEPMVREDFPEIFDYITSKAKSYSINTNGTLINREIARLMTRLGNKLVAIYGATADVHDYITKQPGSFDAAMHGFSLLKEAGAGFTVQVVPMKANHHQFDRMVELAKSLSTRWRIGANWLYLSASGFKARNEEILEQRLPPKKILEMDQPSVGGDSENPTDTENDDLKLVGDDRLFASCIASRRDFHIDPYGYMSFCCYIKDSKLRYDLREGTVEDCWERFIPSLADEIRGGDEFKENCGSCEYRNQCKWCAAYAYLEHGRYPAKVEFLCEFTKESRKFMDNWIKNHRRYYMIADITVQVESDLPIADDTFEPKFKIFETDGPGNDTIYLRHHFSFPDLSDRDLGTEVHRRPPWAIYRKDENWIYMDISPRDNEGPLAKVAIFSEDYSRGEIFHKNDKYYRNGNLDCISLAPTDQILMAQVLADRNGCFLHSSGVILDGQGLIFVGHSGAGKTTMAKMLMGEAKILCDDRNILRKKSDGMWIYGTWNHGLLPEVSNDSAPLRGILFLEQAKENRIERIREGKEVRRRLLACLVKPFGTSEWWKKALDLIEEICANVPCYIIRFDKSGEVVKTLRGKWDD